MLCPYKCSVYRFLVMGCLVILFQFDGHPLLPVE